VGTFTTIKDTFFEVGIVDYDEAVKIDGELLVDYNVTNIGEVSDTQDIYFEVYNYFGEKQYTDLEENIELNEGEAHDEEFTWESENPGEYYFKVWTEDDEEERTFLVFEEPYFQVTIDEPKDEEDFLEDETVAVEYTVENLGAVYDTQEIKFYVDTNLIDTEEVGLDGDSTHSNTFEWTAEEPYGERDFTIVSDDDSDTVTITVLKEAYFEVEITEPEEGEEYIEGQRVRVEYTVENTGDITDIQNIELYVDENLVETKGDLDLEGGDIYDGEFTWTATEPYEDRVLTVESDDDQDDVTIALEEAPEEPYFDVYIETPSDGDEYIEGETVRIEYSIKNLGGETGTQDIELYDGYNIIETKEVEIDASSTYSDTFDWTAEEPYGTRELRVESEDHHDAVTITVLKEAYFEVEITEPIEGEEYIEGQRVRVKYKVENTGDIQDIQNITFYVDGNLIERKGNLGLKGGEIYEENFLWVAEEPYGTRGLKVESEDHQDDVTIIVQEAPEEPFFDVFITAPSDGDEFVENRIMEVRYSVKNLGEETGTQDIEFRVDGNLVEAEDGVELSGEATYSGAFNWTVEAPYEEQDITVLSYDYSYTVTIQVLEEAYFEVDIKEPTEGEKFIEGEPLRVGYTIENTGDVTAIQNIELYVDGNLVDVRNNLGLEGGEIYEGDFIWIAEEPFGERNLKVESGDDYDTVNVMVFEDPYFEVNIIEVGEGQEYIEGETLTVEYYVENIGYVEDTQDMEFYVDGALIETEEGVILDGGLNHTGTFTWTAEEPFGERNLTVESRDDFDLVTITVLKDAFFEIGIVDYDGQIVEGEEFLVYYEVENIGDVPDTQDIQFTVYDDDGDEVYSHVKEDIELNGGESYEGEFSWEAEDLGDYSFEIAIENGNHQEGSLTVESATPSEKGFPGTWWPYLILGIAALAVIIGGGIYKKHLTTKEPVIEEVFLISQRNSMLLLHNTRRLRPDRDSDIIAGMFEAVQNFIEDSFQDTGDWELNKLEFGGNKIVVERGKYVYMAVVYEGDLSEEKIQEIRDVIERIEDEFGEQLKEWDGDRKELRGIKDMTQDLFS